MKTKIARNIFLVLLGFLAIGAIGGGVVLIISPTGELIGIPLSEFKNIPFNSYLIPVTASLKKRAIPILLLSPVST